MLKRWFDFSSNGNGHAATAVADGERRNGFADTAVAAPEDEEGARPPRPAPVAPEPAVPVAAPADSGDFARIYQGAGIGRGACGILKVVDMIHSPHLSGMSPEGKRCAVRMALDAVGASVESVLQDGVARQSALNEYEKDALEKLRAFEEVKAEESRKLQADLDRLTRDFMERMQAAMDEVSREQDRFRAWQKRKQLELQKIAEAAALCVPEGMGSHGIGLSAVLERACAAGV